MRRLTTDVLVIGGGATGAGAAWDAALRGLDVILVERADLAEGTSGRFHGLLHSGARYAVKDPRAARECIAENRILRHVAADCVEDTGGLFVTTPWDDPAYADRLIGACAATGVDCEEVTTAQARREEPRLQPRITRALRVPDASIDIWKTVWALARGAEQHGARILTYHEVTAIRRSADRVVGAVVRDRRGGEQLEIEAAVTVNATGAWAGAVAALAGAGEVRIFPGRGIMIAIGHRLVNTVINRCQMPADGDILVPIRTVSVIGSTDQQTADPDDQTVLQTEVDQLLDDGEKLVPGFRQARALRVWSGVRPLFEDARKDATSTRDVTRAHALLDHRERDGIGGFITITGGKATTFRLMAQEAVDAVCEMLGRDAPPCTTAHVPLPGSEAGPSYQPGERLARKEQHLQSAQIVCECELVTREQLEQALARDPGQSLDDLRRRLRLGMGPCQGGFCIFRAAGLLNARGAAGAVAASGALLAFLQERWKGQWPILHGDQLRQARFDEWVFQGLLDAGHLPGGPLATGQASAVTAADRGPA